MAIAPKIIANGPRTLPSKKKPTILKTIEVIARQLVFGALVSDCTGDAAIAMSIDAVGLDMMMKL